MINVFWIKDKNPLNTQVQEIPQLMSLRVDKPENFIAPQRAVRTAMHGRCVNYGKKGHRQSQCQRPKTMGDYCPVCFRDRKTRETCKFCKYVV